MGCASSKHRKRCLHCRRGYSPVDVPRSQSVHGRQPPQHSEDSCHMVALSSSSLGSLKLCDSSFGHNHKQLADFSDKLVAGESGGENQISGNGFGPKQLTEKEKSNLELQAKLMEAKVWSSMMNEKIPKTVPKTPVVTPPGEPETINTWEMMDGLEDVISPLRSPNHVRSFSFHVARNGGDCEHPKSKFQENGNVKPLWLQMEEEGLESSCRFEDFDPDIISSFRKSLQGLPSDHPFHISVGDLEKFHFSDEDEEKEEEKKETLGKEKVIVYFTSLRGIRKTYEESCDVRVILKSIGIRVDERDVSMHSGFKDELKELLGDKFSNGVGITLPRVFLGRKYLGGAEEIRKLNEDGKLEKILEGCERVEESQNGNVQECEACGDVRFVPCETCSGSCKVYYESEDEDDKEEDDGSVKEEREYGFQTCPDCNENGLIRCPLCCD